MVLQCGRCGDRVGDQPIRIARTNAGLDDVQEIVSKIGKRRVQ